MADKDKATQLIQLKEGIIEIDKKNSLIGNSSKDFEILKELGKGSYGIVFLVKQKKPQGDTGFGSTK